MAEEYISQLQDELICCVCLDILKDPISLQCGHSFCKECINSCWDNYEELLCRCPSCRSVNIPRPDLQKNILLNKIARELRVLTLPTSQSAAGAQDIACDFCKRNKFRAVKSCLTCRASFCEIHIQPHQRGPAWINHRLVKPSRNLEKNFCTEHQKLLELFCRSDQMCICSQCGVTEHRGHDLVGLEAERAEKETELEAARTNIRNRIQQRQGNVGELRQTVNRIKASAERELQETERAFTVLINSINETRRKVVQLIKDMERTEVEKVEGPMRQLQTEIMELKRRDEHLVQLSESEDSIHFLQNFTSPYVLPDEEDPPHIDVCTEVSSVDLREELSHLKERLEQIGKWTFLRVDNTDLPVFFLIPPQPRNREDFLQYSCQLTLDPDTVNEHLSISDGNRKVMGKDRTSHYPDHPDRFDSVPQVLCREDLSRTRCYWEVERSGNPIVIGVAYKSLSRRGGNSECIIGGNNKSWCLFCSDSSPSVCHQTEMTEVAGPLCSRIGIYVDRCAGTLSFYNVSNTMTLLHSFTTSFTEPLHAGFWANQDTSLTIC
ncbi:tripartite motif-containing protein 16-like isoform X1 [Erpetoichthys calabaricus]|uniref:tripartite motif-containing protein 16-like isoform X1 n=1 Tax=Erpetoichthys calabaricus TaxID=27687 RepID=UPI002233EAD6|nr:tripartite motif-containing protein 16-like isoform X1 [Erpetoichthys calabaricus]